MNNRSLKNRQRLNRSRRSRARLSSSRPRLSIFRSHRYIYAQLIDDFSGRTLASASSFELKNNKQVSGKTNQAKLVGELIAKRALEQGIESVAFDRGRYRYHGRLRALAETARAQGLKF